MTTLEQLSEERLSIRRSNRLFYLKLGAVTVLAALALWPIGEKISGLLFP